MTVRLATYNLLHGMTGARRDGRARPRRGRPRRSGHRWWPTTARCARPCALLDADVLGLQEVDVDQPRSGVRPPGAGRGRGDAARRTGTSPRRSPARPARPGWAHADDAQEARPTRAAGRPPPRSADARTTAPASRSTRRCVSARSTASGLVSRLPVARVAHARASTQRRGACRCSSRPSRARGSSRCPTSRAPRSPPWSRVRAGRSRSSTAHLSFVPGYNVRQLRALRRWLAGLPRPLVLLGDFNLPGRMPALRHRLGRRWSGPPPTRSSGRAPSSTTSSSTASRPRRSPPPGPRPGAPLPVSDHAAVTVDLDL